MHTITRHLYRLETAMVRRPNASDTLVQASNRLLRSLQLLPAGLLEEVRFLQNLLLGHIPHTDGFDPAVNVVALEDRVLLGSRGDADFNLGVGFGEGRKFVL